jgi:arabinofuranosyltransferase
MNSKLIRNFLFALLVFGFLDYSYQYIQKSSFLVGDKTYYVLFDDAMISMRYGYNLAHGFGLVWNPAEYVEGFTNPLWVGLMALVHLFPIPLSHTSLVIQIIGAVFLALNLFFVKKVVEHFTDNLFVMLVAVALTAFYAPLNTWGLLGMEVSVLALIVTAAVWMVITQDINRFSPWTYILLAVSTLIRMDMLIPFVIVIAVMFFVQPQFRKQHLIWGLGLLFLFLGGQTLARYLYYGEFLPNTYYLKIEGFPLVLRVIRGSYALFHLIYYANWIIFILPLSLFFFRRDWKVNFIFLIILGQIAYSVYVGGDAWEHKGGANRFISIAMPVYFATLAWAMDEIRKSIVAGFKHSSRSSRIATISSQVAYVVLAAFVLLSFNALLGEWKSIERWRLTRDALFLPGNDMNLAKATALEIITKPEATIAVVGAGTIPYFLPDRHMLDIMGKMDPVIAHGPVRSPMSIEDVTFLRPGYDNIMRPGHMKWNYAYTFGELKPDVIVSIWVGTTEEAQPYLEKDYVNALIGEKLTVYLRKDSPNIYWDKVIIKN